jgi:hypothetical protein
LPCAFGTRPPVAAHTLTMSLTNLTDTHRAPAAPSGDRQGPKMVVSKARATAK